MEKEREIEKVSVLEGREREREIEKDRKSVCVRR